MALLPCSVNVFLSGFKLQVRIPVLVGIDEVVPFIRHLVHILQSVSFTQGVFPLKTEFHRIVRDSQSTGTVGDAGEVKLIVVPDRIDDIMPRAVGLYLLVDANIIALLHNTANILQKFLKLQLNF